MDKRGIIILFLLFFTILAPKNTRALSKNFGVFSYNNDANTQMSTNGKSLMKNGLENCAKNLDMEALLAYLNSQMSEFGGIRIRRKGIDYINSTYFGTLSFILTGKEDEMEKSDKLADYLQYLYDNETGGFRNWLDGEISLISTVFGLLIMNVTGVHFAEFNATLTWSYLFDHGREGDFIDDDGSEGLLITAFSVIGLYFLNRSTDLTKYSEYIFSFYSAGLFVDEEDSNSPLFQTKMAIEAIKVINPELLNQSIRNEIKSRILSLKYSGTETELLGGFSSKEDKPTVFETGLALSILSEIGYYNKTLVEEAIKFVNCSQALDGGIYTNSIEQKEDIFQVFGALYIYYLSGLMNNYYKVEHEIIPSEQIPIDYIDAEVRLSIDLFGDFIECFSVNYTIFNTSIAGDFAQGEEEYLVQIDPEAFGIGNYIMNLSIYPAIWGFYWMKYNYSIDFRIGYNISVQYAPSTPTPGDILNLTTIVSFYNGTLITSGQLKIEIKYEDVLVYTHTEDLSSPTNPKQWAISESAPLGYYTIIAKVNDSYGSDHTYTVIRLLIHDNISIEVSNLKEAYSLGDWLNISLNLRYQTNHGMVPNNNSVYLVLQTTTGEIWENASITWNTLGEIFIEKRIPCTIPPSDEVEINIQIIWLGKLSSNIAVSRVNITLDDLEVIIKEASSPIYLGQNVSTKFIVIAASSNQTIENASIKAEIRYANKTAWYGLGTYNMTTEVYQINQYLTPNVPEGNYTLQYFVYIPFWENYTKIDVVEEKSIEILGTLKLESYRIEGTLRVFEVIKIFLNITCHETKEYLRGLTGFVNISAKDYITQISLNDLGNGTYMVIFIPQKAGEHHLEVIRSIDNTTIDAFELNIKALPTTPIEFFSQYGSMIVGGISIAMISTYLIIRYYLSSKISKRYLIKLRKKRTKKKK